MDNPRSGSNTPVQRRSLEATPVSSTKVRRNTVETEGNDEPAPLPISNFMQKQAVAMAQRRQSNAAAAFSALAALREQTHITDEEGEVIAGPGYYPTNKVLTVTNRTFQSNYDDGFFAKGTEVNSVVRTTGALKTHTRETVCSKKAFPGGFATVLARQERFGRDLVSNSSPLKKGNNSSMHSFIQDTRSIYPLPHGSTHISYQSSQSTHVLPNIALMLPSQHSFHKHTLSVFSLLHPVTHYSFIHHHHLLLLLLHSMPQKN